MRTIRLVLAVLLVAAALVLTAYPVLADNVYPSEHVAFAPVVGDWPPAEFPLQSGFVENIHANGQTVAGRAVYVLNGARPNTWFDVHWFLYADPGCTMEPVLGWFIRSIVTNGAGNGELNEKVLIPGVVPGTTYGVRWELRLAATAVYATQCTTIVWD